MPVNNDKSDYLVGVDLGGTKIYAGVFDSRLTLLGTTKVSTKSDRGADSVIDRITRCVRDVIDECDLTHENINAVGVGAPGAVESDTGCVVFAPDFAVTLTLILAGVAANPRSICHGPNRVAFNP